MSSAMMISLAQGLLLGYLYGHRQGIKDAFGFIADEGMEAAKKRCRIKERVSDES